MHRQRDDDGAPRSGGRSGNDFLGGTGEGYESWAADGPSGATGHGGYAGDVPALQDTATFRAVPSDGSAERGEREGGSGVLPLLVAAGVGAALMYFLDGERGAERRRQAADRLMGAVRSGQRAAQGAVAGVRERVSHEREPGDDVSPEDVSPAGASPEGASPEPAPRAD